MDVVGGGAVHNHDCHTDLVWRIVAKIGAAGDYNGRLHTYTGEHSAIIRESDLDTGASRYSAYKLQLSSHIPLECPHLFL